MKRKHNDLVTGLLFVLGIAAIAWTLGYMTDIDNARFEARQYCHKVHDKVWPDFKKNYSIYCTKTGEWNGK